jgi:uroporphyrinogen decarboxylase
MSGSEKQAQREDIADVYIEIARKYGHSAIFFHGADWGEDSFEESLNCLDIIRDKSGDEFFLMMHGDATYEVPQGGGLVEFVNRLADNPEGVKAEAKDMVARALEMAERAKGAGALDAFALCSDYCFNTGPFLSPAMFDDFVGPYLKELISGYRELGFYTIKHTDGNIMPILDRLVDCRPDALHSLDPQGGVDIAEVKKTAQGKLCLIGNVNCGLLDSGSDEDVIESASYALENGMPGGGYIFSTSNCVYTGMKLERYELMLNVWRNKGVYK